MSQTPEVPVDVLPPLPSDAQVLPRQPDTGTTPFPGLRTFYHPASGIVILGIDFIVFGTELLSGFLATPIMCVLAFLATFPLVYLIQTKWTKDTGAAALGKAFLGAFMAGLPFSIAGTIYGAGILALSGLPHHPAEAVKRFIYPNRKQSPKCRR